MNVYWPPFLGGFTMIAIGAVLSWLTMTPRGAHQRRADSLPGTDDGLWPTWWLRTAGVRSAAIGVVAIVLSMSDVPW